MTHCTRAAVTDAMAVTLLAVTDMPCVTPMTRLAVTDVTWFSCHSCDASGVTAVTRSSENDMTLGFAALWYTRMQAVIAVAAQMGVTRL